MQSRYYICGLRPVIQEIEEDFDTFYAFQWNTGAFEEDMSYSENINFDPSGDVEEVSKEEFETYVKKLKQQRELP